MRKKIQFITFEGVEGSGKTTQIQLLKQYLEKKKHSVIVTKEPGGTPIGTEFRRLLLDSRNKLQSPYTEILLFTADRLEHIEQVIKPALANNQIVICDRFTDSTIAYQQAGRNIPDQVVSTLINLTNIKPDLTFLLDMDPEISLKRARNRPTDIHTKDETTHDRFEKEALHFHQKIREQYLIQAQNEPNRIKIIEIFKNDAIIDIFQKISQITQTISNLK